jgi:hypothetical protein
LITLGLSKDELRFLNNALNEVCHGTEVPEFATRKASLREDVQAVRGYMRCCDPWSDGFSHRLPCGRLIVP